MRYFMGLDMGTSSVGWAVTDEHYQLLRRKGKDMWGINWITAGRFRPYVFFSTGKEDDMADDSNH